MERQRRIDRQVVQIAGEWMSAGQRSGVDAVELGARQQGEHVTVSCAYPGVRPVHDAMTTSAGTSAQEILQLVPGIDIVPVPPMGTTYRATASAGGCNSGYRPKHSLILSTDSALAARRERMSSDVSSSSFG